MLSGLPEQEIRIVLLNTGLLSDNPLPFTQISEILDMGVDSVRKAYKRGIEYLSRDDIKQQLKGLI